MTAERVDTIVRGGTLVRPSGAAEAAIAISDGKIVAIASEEMLPPADSYLEAAGKYVFPGLVDVHTHIYLDSYRTISQSAAAGGVTTILSYIWPDQSMDVPGSIEHWRRFGESAAVVDFGLHVGLMDCSASLDQIGVAAEMGVASFKMMMDYKRRGLMVSDEFMLAAMERVAAAGGMAAVHCENGGIIAHLEEKSIAEGLTAATDYPRTRPPEAEAEAIQRAIAIASLAGCPLYLVHVTTARGLELVADAQAAGQQVWAEACLPYLMMTEEEYERQGPLVKIAPPLRAEADRQALWSALERGIISTVASDHCAYSRAMKASGWSNVFQAPYGIPGIETLLPLLFSEGVGKHNLPIAALPHLLSEHPAKLFGLYPRKGTIEVGSDADLVIFDPEKEVTIMANVLHTRADFTPYEGRKVRGWPVATMVRGRLVVQDGEPIDVPAFGEYLQRKPASRAAA